MGSELGRGSSKAERQLQMTEAAQEKARKELERRLVESWTWHQMEIPPGLLPAVIFSSSRCLCG